MTKRTLISLLLAGLIVAMLGVGYAIVATNGSDGGAAGDAAGFIH
jgi:hypothetical protein